MHNLDSHGADQSFDDGMLDQDFDDWQSDMPLSDMDNDGDFAGLSDDGFEEIAGDSHFFMHELDFSGDHEAF